jgi:adenylate cyclase, class 2
MAYQDVELEIKLPLLNPQAVQEFLNKNAQSKVKGVYQKDTYYMPVHRDFVAVKYPYEWLRIRESDKGASLNYKHFHPENVKITDYCDEYETKIDNPHALKKMFTSLDIKELVVVEKKRSTWLYKDVEVALDLVTALGSFIEIEATLGFENPKAGKKYLYTILEELQAQVGPEDHRGYPYLLLKNKV